MRSRRAVALEAQLDWGATLHYRRGAHQRLRGIDVFYDFPWKRHFRDRRAQFRNGQSLAEQVIEDCPRGKRPALLLTDRDDVEEGARNTDDSYVMVVNLPRYLANADANVAAAYLARRLGRGITRAKSFSEISQADAEEIDRWLDESLNAQTLARWVGDTARTPNSGKTHAVLGGAFSVQIAASGPARAAPSLGKRRVAREL